MLVGPQHEYLRFHGIFNGCQKLIVGFQCRNIRIGFLDGIGGAEQETGLAGADHAQVIEAVAAGDGLYTGRLERLHRAILGIFNSHLEIGDFAVFGHHQCIAEQGRLV